MFVKLVVNDSIVRFFLKEILVEFVFHGQDEPLKNRDFNLFYSIN